MYSDEAMKTQGAFSWNELMTSDVEGAKAFYGELLGWQLEDEQTSCGAYTFAKLGDKQVAGIMATPEEAKPMPPSWGAYLTVDDVDAAAAKVQQLGGKLLLGPQDIDEVGRFVVIQDPQGAYISLITYFSCDK